MSRSSASWWVEADRALAAVLRWGSMLCLAFLLVLLASGVLVRFAPLFSMGWADEVVELAFAWMVFLGTAVLWRDGKHIAVDFLLQGLSGSLAGRLLALFVALLSLGFLALFSREGWLLTLQAVGNRTPILELPRLLWYAALPVSGLLMLGYSVRGLWRLVRGLAGNQEAHE